MIFTGYRSFTERTYPAVHPELWHGAPRYLVTEAYPDAEFTALVADTARLSGDGVDAVLRGFGAYAGATTFRFLYPDYYAAHDDTISFLEEIESLIHASVRRTIPGALPPSLSVRRVDDANLVISYTSERGLCAVLEGIVAGVARHYGEQVRVAHPLCMKHGEPACTFVVSRESA